MNAAADIEIRRPNDDEWTAICFADGRAFGNSYTPEEIAERRPIHDLGRFRVAVDRRESGRGSIVAVAGSYALDVTLPGGATVPMGGVTWVSVATTHRRQGLMRRVVGAVHDDIDERGEPLATLGASEGGIYSHLGYGVVSEETVVAIKRRDAVIRADLRVDTGSVRLLDEDADVERIIGGLWERFRRCRAGEVRREPAFHDFLFTVGERGMDGMSREYFLVHADGYARYRMRAEWANGHPAHDLHLTELCAITPEAHLALWQTLLDVDLVGEIRSRAIAPDDPLPHLLDNPRAVRATNRRDGVWRTCATSRSASARARTARRTRSSSKPTARAGPSTAGLTVVVPQGPHPGGCRHVARWSQLAALRGRAAIRTRRRPADDRTQRSRARSRRPVLPHQPRPALPDPLLSRHLGTQNNEGDQPAM